jgi:threonine dehydrogenase-like Zn-dependent dehydrogenase
MKALTFRGKGNIRYEDVPDPKIMSDDDAVVRVTTSAVCGSDLHVYHEREKGLDRGTVMGHEFVGIVEETGRNIRNFSAGDHVVSPFTTNCGKCHFCDIGLTARCTNGELFGWVENGVGLQGAQAEYVRVPHADTTLVHIPETITGKQALLTGDILSTGYYCAEMAGIRPGGFYAVIGCGPVGILTIMSAFEQGAQHIIAIDTVPGRLELASRLGAIPLQLNEDPVLNVMSRSGGTGVDAVMEAAGSPGAQDLAVKLVRPGGTISTVGVHTAEQFSFTPAEAYDRNLTYKTGRCPARFYMDILMVKLEDWPFDLDMIFSHELPMADGEHAYKIFDQKLEDSLKILLRP